MPWKAKITNASSFPHGVKVGFARIDIRDSGPGLPPERLAHMFDPFFTTKAPGVGLGLGLTISAGIVRDFGGELVAFNAEGGGAVFSMTIPVNAGEAT